MRIAHVALWTADLDRAREFYAGCLGGRGGEGYRNPRTGFESCFLEFDSGARLEIMRRPDVAGRSGPGAGGAEARGFAHVAFAVGSRAEVDRLTAALRDAGIVVLREPRTTGDGYYESVVLDPDGNRVEITE